MQNSKPFTNSDLVQEHKSAKEKSSPTITEADVKAAETLEVQILVKNFDENLILANTLADVMTDLSQVLMSAKKDRQEVLDAESAAANSNGVVPSNFNPSDTANSSLDKLRRRADHGASHENAKQGTHTDEGERHSGVVIQHSQIKETTVHSKFMKTTSSGLTTDKSHIMSFSQVGQVEPAVPSSSLRDVSEPLPPTPIRLNAKPNYRPLRAAQRSSHGSREEETQHYKSRESIKTWPARCASVQDPRSISRRESDSLASKRTPERKQRISNIVETLTPQADKRSVHGGRNVVFDDHTATGAAFRRMTTIKTQAKSDSSTQVPPSPRGILKEPNTLKRSAAAAGFKAPRTYSRAGKSTKVSESQRNALGPIIADSQSPQKTTRRN
ncbi:MAG: hypothetical protein LQ347_004495, partial [Umbilicaria vellea]